MRYTFLKSYSGHGNINNNKKERKKKEKKKKSRVKSKTNLTSNMILLVFLCTKITVLCTNKIDFLRVNATLAKKKKEKAKMCQYLLYSRAAVTLLFAVLKAAYSNLQRLNPPEANKKKRRKKKARVA